MIHTLSSRPVPNASNMIQKAKQELLKFKDQDPVELIKRPRREKKKPEKGVQAFFITEFDARMPHPRKLISQNYHHIESNPVLAGLFPRKWELSLQQLHQNVKM